MCRPNGFTKGFSKLSLNSPIIILKKKGSGEGFQIFGE